MSIYQLDGYDSENTCCRKEIKAKDFLSAVKKTLKVKNDFKMIVYGGTNEGVEIENKEITSATNNFGFGLNKKDYCNYKFTK